MRRNGYLWTSGVNLDTAVQFADPDFLLECKISSIWRCFPLIFAFYMPKVRHILLPVCLTYWPRKYTSRVDPHVDNSHQVWSPYADPFLSYEWCAESRDPWVGVKNNYIFGIPDTRFAYSLHNFYWATTTIKGRLLSSITNAKALDCVNLLCVTLWPWPLTFWPWAVVVHGESRDQPRHQVWRPYGYLFLSCEL